MTTFKVVPLDMINQPNDFGFLQDTQWQIVGNNAVTLWFQFRKVDMLGERRYLVANPGSVQVAFLRADSPGQPANMLNNSMFTPVSQVQTITITATPYSTDRSLFSMPLTQQQAQAITSGSIQITLTEGAVVQTWNQNYAVKKILSLEGC